MILQVHGVLNATIDACRPCLRQGRLRFAFGEALENGNVSVAERSTFGRAHRTAEGGTAVVADHPTEQSLMIIRTMPGHSSKIEAFTGAHSQWRIKPRELGVYDTIDKKCYTALYFSETPLMFRIKGIIWDEEAESHIWVRHRVATNEAEEAAYSAGWVVRGRGCGVYEIFGRTDAGRYLLVIIRLLERGMAKIITARDMTATEKSRYQRQVSH